ncbi:VOC family protein [Myxosarcina sp. GI1(2024)]
MKLDRFEHLNLSCQEIDASQHFYQTLFPDWYVRAQGKDENGRRWRHFENERIYIALNDAINGDRQQYLYEGIGINHIDFVIDDGKQLQETLKANKIEYYTLESLETKYRIYVSDPDGNEIEFVEYTKDYPLR